MNEKRADKIRVTERHRLFVDDWVVSTQRNATRTLHQVTKHPDNPIMFPCRPWEGIKIKLYGAVIRDEEDGLFKMWYLGGNSDGKDRQNRNLYCYATSQDGLHWQRPELGLHEYTGHRNNNIVFRPHLGNPETKGRLAEGAFIKDSLDPDPARRYKMISYQYNDADYYSGDVAFATGAYSACSPDGLRWVESPEPLFKMCDSIGDTVQLMHDTLRGRYIAFVKVFYDSGKRTRLLLQKDAVFRVDAEGKSHRVDPATENPTIRHRAVSVSEDFVHWTDPELMFAIDEKDAADVEHYNNNGFVYESQYLGLLSIYHTASGCQDFQLISSHDGEHWDRAFERAAFLPSGRPYLDWDFGTSAIANTPPILVGDELWFYYCASWGIHGPNSPGRVCPQKHGQAGYGIGLARLRRDGFVSLDAGGEEAFLETDPLVLEKGELFINADCARGSMWIEITDDQGKVIEGRGRNDCLPITGDKVAHPVRWGDGRSLLDYGNREVRVRFYWQHGSLYSFWCDPRGETHA